MKQPETAKDLNIKIPDFSLMARKKKAVFLVLAFILLSIFSASFSEASLLGSIKAMISKLTAATAIDPTSTSMVSSMGVRGSADPFFNYESYASKGQSFVSITTSGNTATADMDYDGVPDWYENMVNPGGFSRGYKMSKYIYEAQTVLDYDGDGCTNYEEYYNYKQLWRCANVPGVCPSDSSIIEIVRCSDLEEQNMPPTATVNGVSFLTNAANMSFLKQANATVTHSSGNITFSGANMLDINLSHITIGQDYVFVNISAWPGLNKSAIITLKGLADAYFGNDASKPPAIMRDGEKCNSHCSNIVWSSSTDTLKFTVNGFPTGNLTGLSYYVVVNSTVTGANDDDGDMIPDTWSGVSVYCNSTNNIRCIDNCGLTSNPDQKDFDNDNLGDACDTDKDNDGYDSVDYAGEDCDDFNPLIDGNSENTLARCQDGLDNDCNGVLDGYDAVGCSGFVFFPSGSDDADGDGLTNSDEKDVYHTNYKKADTDGDGLTDGQEVACGYDPNDNDDDNDGLKDGIEDPNGNCVIDGCSESNVTNAMTDGLTNDKLKYDWNNQNHPRGLCEVCVGQGSNCRNNPNWEDKCSRGALCLTAADTDGDGITDPGELANSTDPTDIDIDNDGLNNTEEIGYGTNMSLFDTDFDGLSDYEETFTYPACNALDNDTNDYGMTDGMKILTGLSCSVASSNVDGDSLSDATDPILGEAGDVTISGISAIEIKVNENADLDAADYDDQEMINITGDGEALMFGEYNFTGDICKMTLTDAVVMTSTTTDEYGWAMISGVLQCGATKTLFIPAKKDTKRVCVKDAEINSIGDISDSCTGTNEIFFDDCGESVQTMLYNASGELDTTNEYNCTYLASEEKYMIEGLHHSAGIETTNSRLNISSDTDTATKYIADTVWFYANFSNRTSGEFITGDACNITFDAGATWLNMTEGPALYNYSNVFAAAGTFQYNVSCNATGFDAINLMDTYSIYVRPIPEFSTITLMLAMVIVVAGFFAIRRRA